MGGQGILSIATVIGSAALQQGLYLKQAEVHGMSQRGGDVQSNLRLSSDPIHSDLIPKGGADLIVSLEPMEALRYLPYLSKDGWIITNTTIEIIVSSRSSLIKLLRKQGSAERSTSSSLEATYMPLIQRLSSFAWKHSSGPSSGRTSEKEVSKYIRCTTLRLLFQHSST